MALTLQYLTTPGGLEVVVLKAARQVVLQRLPGEEFTVVPCWLTDDFLESISALKRMQVEQKVL